MRRVIPILPCVSIDELCAFYESLGFTVTDKYRSPNPYAVICYDDIVLHFWGSKKNDPLHNASMVYVEVNDVGAINEQFCSNIKAATGKVPRAGFGRITKVRHLKDDRRFTICDPAGNTLYVGTTSEENPPERTLENETYAKRFATIYDLLHSKEDPEMALKAMAVFAPYRAELSDADKHKVDKLEAEIREAAEI